jgi:hypothetical protein
MNERYAPHETFMSNVVKTSGCRPLFNHRRRSWIRKVVASLFIIAASRRESEGSREIMKHFCCFSEPIREGAKLRPQCFDGGYSDDMGATCAYIAGIEAVMGDLSKDAMSMFGTYGTYPYLMDNAVCPVHDCRLAEFTDSRLSAIFHLNDDHKWTREQIADWLQSEEVRNLKQELSDLGEALKVTV